MTKTLTREPLINRQTSRLKVNINQELTLEDIKRAKAV
jgi:7-keto-8-aminopelargonate synthetase-like enzyme